MCGGARTQGSIAQTTPSTGDSVYACPHVVSLQRLQLFKTRSKKVRKLERENKKLKVLDLLANKKLRQEETAPLHDRCRTLAARAEMWEERASELGG